MTSEYVLIKCVVKELRTCLGMISYYRTFIPHFSKRCALLYNLTHDDVDFKWTQNEELILNDMKYLFVDWTYSTSSKFFISINFANRRQYRRVGCYIVTNHRWYRKNNFIHQSNRTTKWEKLEYSATWSFGNNMGVRNS